MKSDTHLKARNYFDSEIKEYYKTIEKRINQFIQKLHLDNLCKENQLIKLHAELQTLKQSQIDSDRKEYFLFHDNQDQLFSLFFSRLLVYDLNDIPFIKETILLDEKIKRIQLLIQHTQEELPTFTFSDYLHHSTNVVFYKLQQRPIKTSLEDYNKIREHHYLQILSILQLELQHLKNSFLQHSFPVSIQKIIKEISNINNFHQLAALKNSTLPTQLDPYYTKPETNEMLQITLEELELTLTNYKTSQKPNISNHQIFYFSLKKYNLWLESLMAQDLTNKITVSNKIIDLNEIFSIVHNRAKQDAHTEIKEKKTPSAIDEIVEILNEIQQICIHDKVSLFPYSQQNCSKIKRRFFNHLILKHNYNISITKLYYSIKHSILVDHYTNQLNILYKKFHIKDDFPTYAQIIDLLPLMIPNSETFNQLLEVITLNTNLLEQNEKPSYFIEQEIKTQLINTYNPTADNMENLYYSTNKKITGYHATLQKRKLERLKGKYQRYNIPSCQQLENLKAIFVAEANLVQELHQVKDIDIDKLLYPKPQPNIAPTLSFGFRYANTQKLFNIISALNLHFNLLKPINSAKQLTEILTCSDLSSREDKILLNCKTNEFKFIIKQLQPLFKSLTYKNIDKSGIFYTKKGNLLTAYNLASSSTERLDTSQRILKIIENITN